MSLRFTIRDLRLIGIGCLLVGLLFGCNDTTPTPAADSGIDTAAADANGGPAAPTNNQATGSVATATPTPALSGRITLWHSWAEADGDALTQILAAFQQRYPNLAVDTLFVGEDDLPQGYADAVLAGGGPDVLLSPAWWLDDMVQAGVVQPLDEQVPANELAAYWPAALAHLRRNDALYGLPTSFEVVSLYYNRALVAPEQLPATTDALLALAQANPQQGSGLYSSLYHLYWGLPAYGSQLLDANGRAILDQNDGAANFLTWLAALHAAPGSYVDPDYGMVLDRFKKGEFAFFVDGPWAIDELRAALGENLGVMLLPAGPAGPARPWLSADGVFLNPRATPEQQQKALAFARFVTSAEAGAILSRTAHRLPANLATDLGADPLVAGFMQQAAAAQAMPGLPEMANVWGYGGDMITKVLNGVDEAALIVAETTTLINEANGK